MTDNEIVWHWLLSQMIGKHVRLVDYDFCGVNACAGIVADLLLDLCNGWQYIVAHKVHDER